MASLFKLLFLLLYGAGPIQQNQRQSYLVILNKAMLDHLDLVMFRDVVPVVNNGEKKT